MTAQGRTPPHNLEAEESLLGAMLLSRDAIAVAVPIVTAADFYKQPSNALVFGAIVALYKDGQPTDVVSVGDSLGRRNELEAAGGNGRLVTLQARTPATTSAGRYARIIAEHATLRRLAGVGSQISDMAYGAPEDVEGTLDRARALVSEIRSPMGSLPAELWSVDDYIDWQPDDPERNAAWLVPGFLREMDRLVLVAGEGSGKTVWLSQIAMAASQGINPFTLRPMSPIVTLRIDAENPPYLVRQWLGRMRKLVPGYEPKQAYLWHRPSGIDLLRPAARSHMESILATVQPRLVCAGPLNKLTRGEKKDEGVVGALWDVLDDFRERYRFALVLEHHAPLSQGGKREMRAYGSQITTSRPEFGIGLVPCGEGQLRLEHFRRQRDPRPWPEEIHYGGPGSWPWVGRWSGGMPMEPGLDEAF